MSTLWRSMVQRPGTRAALTGLALIAFGAAAAGLLAPHDPVQQFRESMLQPPQGFGGSHPLGTDELGRDLLSRLLHGAQLTGAIAVGGVALAVVPGVMLGLVAAFYPRVAGTLILRAADVLLTLPTVLLAIAVVAILGPGLLNTIIAIAVAAWPGYVRLTRACALGELAKGYVMAAHSLGASRWRLMIRTVMPNCMGPVIVTATLDFSSAILTAAGLGFLGLGAQPPSPEWGAMLAGARDFIGRASWVVIWPGLAILLTVMCVNVVGDALGDALDPQRAQRSRAG